MRFHARMCHFGLHYQHVKVRSPLPQKPPFWRPILTTLGNVFPKTTFVLLICKQSFSSHANGRRLSVCLSGFLHNLFLLKGQKYGHKAQTNCWLGFLHSCECRLLGIIVTPNKLYIVNREVQVGVWMIPNV